VGSAASCSILTRVTLEPSSNAAKSTEPSHNLRFCPDLGYDAQAILPLEAMSEIEEINKLVTFGLVDGKLRILQVNANVWGDVKGNIQGSVRGDIYGDVEGSVEGYVGRDVGANVGRHVLGNVNGNVEGSVWGDVKGDVWGQVVGKVEGNAEDIVSDAPMP